MNKRILFAAALVAAVFVVLSACTHVSNAKPAKTYTVTFNKNGGDTEADPKTATVTAPAKTVAQLPKAPTRKNYAFTGWNTKEDGSGSAFSTAMTITEDITVYAQWTNVEALTYTVTFNNNGGDTEADPKTKTVTPPAKNIDELPRQPLRMGYAFTEWNTKEDGSGDAFSADTAVTANRTVYAQWELVPVNAFLVIFDRNGGETDAAPVAKIILPPETTIDWLPSAPRRAGYVFSSWNTRADGSGATFTEATQVSANMTVYAQWRTYSYTVTFNTGGADSETPSPVTVASPAIDVGALPPPPLKVGYTFIGWNTKADGTGDLFLPVTQVRGNMTVYAQWTLYIEPFSMRLYENNALVEGVNDFETFVSWVYNFTNISSHTEYRAVFYEDIECPTGLLLDYHGFITNVGITLESNGTAPRQIQMKTNSGLEIGDGFTLKVKNIILRGYEENTMPLIQVDEGGALEMYPGAEISGNVNKQSNSSAVYVKSGGNFAMKGGVIKDNETNGEEGYGAGVFVEDGGTFSMEGDAQVDANNEVYLQGNSVADIAGNLSADSAALLRPATYANGKAVLSGLTAANYGKFAVAPYGSEPWPLDNEGKLIAPRYTISGNIRINGGDANATQVTVQLKQGGVNVGSPVTPNVIGDYAISSVLAGDNYTIAVSLPSTDYTTPTISAFNVTGNTTGKNATLSRRWTISGTVTLTGGGTLSDVTVQLLEVDAGGNMLSIAAANAVKPNGSGNYTITASHDPNTSKYYRVQASLPGYTSGISGANFTLNADRSNINVTLSPAAVWVEANGNEGDTRDFTTLDAAFDWITANATNNGSYKVKLGGDFSISRVLNYTDKNVTITLISDNGSERKITPVTGSSYCLRVHDCTLTLDNGITLTGNASACLVYADNTNAKLNMKAGSAIRDNKTGRGVFVSEGNFTMSGGTISGNTSAFSGGGVLSSGGDSGKFTMSGGIISGNTSAFSGGGVDAGNFTMSGGTISGNTSAYNGGGVHFGTSGTFTMSGGTISGNTSASHGGGVSGTSGTFTMSGGTISNNNGFFGGGVSLEDCTFNMSGTAVISGNVAKADPSHASVGGGVFVRIGTFNMSGGTISGNSVVGYTSGTNHGGGVFLSSTTFRKTGGTIYGNNGGADSNRVLNAAGTAEINNQGHAVFADIILKPSVKRKETTAGPGVNLEYIFNSDNGNPNNGTYTSSGAWDN